MRRQLIRPLVGSTIHRRVATMNPWPDFGPEMVSTVTPALAAAAICTVYPMSTQRWAMVGATRLALRR